MYARRRPGRRTIGVVLPGSFTEIGSLEQVVAHYRPEVIACISEEVLGFGRKLPEASYWGGEPSPCPSQTDFWASERQAATAVEYPCPGVAAGRLLCKRSRADPHRLPQTRSAASRKCLTDSLNGTRRSPDRKNRKIVEDSLETGTEPPSQAPKRPH